MTTQADTTTTDRVSAMQPGHSLSASVGLNPHSSSTPVIDMTSADSEGHTFQGNHITLLSEFGWLINQALSHRVLQQTLSPCEARQVFTAVSIADPLDTYSDIKDAVVKIKYQ
jgi:hypothetical protein